MNNMLKYFEVLFYNSPVTILDSSISFWTDLSASSSVVTTENLSFTSFRNLKTSCGRLSVNSASFSIFCALCFALSWHDPKIPLNPQLPLPKAIQDPKSPTDASAITASGAALGFRFRAWSVASSVFKNEEVYMRRASSSFSASVTSCSTWCSNQSISNVESIFLKFVE